MAGTPEQSNAGCVFALALMLVMLMFYYAIRIGGLRTETRDLQRRVGQLEQRSAK